MRQAKGYSKEDYIRSFGEYVEYGSIQAAASALSEVLGIAIAEAERRILHNSNCDWVVMETGEVITLKAALTMAELSPQNRYAKKYKKQYKIDCITRTEQDIIEKLESVPNKAGYIKSLIRADIKAEERRK